MAKFVTHCGKEFYTSKEKTMIEVLNTIARHGHQGDIWAACVETQDGKVFYSLISGEKPENIKSKTWESGFPISWRKVTCRSQMFDPSTSTMVTHKDGAVLTGW
ncbi:MAG: hypothetical protein IPM57_10740 [Oligoflexia bacterium]|nr:hypothetical protein [Oligoflexia bacterium]